MKIIINITDSKQVKDVQEAFAKEHGYLNDVPNPESRPEQVLNKKGDVKNQAEIDAWKPRIPNPVSKEEFVKECLIEIIKDKTRRYRASQQQHEFDIN